MATTKYSEPFTLGYYVFDLPNGQVLDMLSAELVELPDDLRNLPARYVERDVRFFGENPPQPKGKKVRVPVAPVARKIEPPIEDLFGWGKLSDEELELQMFGNVQKAVQRG
jgi:hypothetical protein